jgi:hypothetical protein
VRAAGVSGPVDVSDPPQASSTVAALRACAGSAVDGVRASFGATSTIPPPSAGGVDRVPAVVDPGGRRAGSVVAGWDVTGQSVSAAARDGEGRDVDDDDVAGQSSVAGREFVGRVVAGQSSPADRDFVGRAVAGGGFGARAAALAAACAAGLLGSNRGGSVPFLT